MQINGKDIQNLFVNMVLKKNSKKTQIQRGTFPYVSSLGNGLKKFQFEIVQSTTTYKPKVVLPKPTPMNHLHWNYTSIL
jgi:hypothetical protein